MYTQLCLRTFEEHFLKYLRKFSLSPKSIRSYKKKCAYKVELLIVMEELVAFVLVPEWEIRISQTGEVHSYLKFFLGLILTTE